MKRKSESHEAGPSGKKITQQKLSQQSFFFRSNCTQEQLNNAIVDHVIDGIKPFTEAEAESFQNIIQLLDPNKKKGGPCYRTVVKLLDEKHKNMKENLLDELSKAVYVAIATVSNFRHTSFYDVYQQFQKKEQVP